MICPAATVFLPRHWIFLLETLFLEVSASGIYILIHTQTHIYFNGHETQRDRYATAILTVPAR